MATLAGQKVKDAYPSLLKLESGTATSSTKVIEDGAGNDTALKLSTVAVEIDGTLIFGTSPTTGSTETSALFLDASGNIVKRTLGSAAFTSGAAISATAPIDFTSDVISLDAPTTLSELTAGTLATADSFLVYDATATAYKYATLGTLTSYFGSNITVLAAGSAGQLQYHAPDGSRAGTAYASYSAAGQLYLSGTELVVRSGQEPQYGTDTGQYTRTGNKTVPNGSTNLSLFAVQYQNYSAMRVFYTAYNVDNSVKTAGEMYVTWDTVAASNIDLYWDIKSNIGADISPKLTFNAAFVTSGGGSVTSATIRVATNTTGETYYINFVVELIKAF